MSLAKTVNLTALLLWNSRIEDSLPIYDFNGKTITRSHLKINVLKNAAELRGLVSPGDRVLISLDDSPSLVSLFLACIAVGAVPAVINPRIRNETLKQIIEHCKPQALFSNQHGIENSILNGLRVFKETNRDEVFSDFSFSQKNDVEFDVENFYGIDPSACCYMQYTSGSTGTPKAVMHSITTTLGFCRAVVDQYTKLGVTTKTYSVPKMFFGYGMGNSLFFPLYAGWHALLDRQWPDIKDIVKNLNQFRPDVFFGVPTIYARLRDYPGIVRSIELAISAGSPLSNEIYQYWTNEGLRIRDGLGATEMGHIFLAQPLDHSSYPCAGAVLPEFEVQLRSEDGTVEERVGVEGTLYVRGVSMCVGYLDNSEATQERFEHGWYNTMDRFSRDEFGLFHFKGRADDLFKVRGRWVTPYAIESQLCQNYPFIAEACLVASHASRDEFNPTLFIVSNAKKVIDAPTLRNWLKDNFDSHMVPRVIKQIESLPRNDNGKLVRSELKSIAHELADSELILEVV